MKKRLLALLLCVTLLASLAVPTLAEEAAVPDGYSQEGPKATVTTYDALLYAQNRNDVDEIIIDGSIEISGDTVITKSLTVREGKELRLDISGDSFGKLHFRPGELTVGSLTGPTLTNNGFIGGEGALWFYSGCTYVGNVNDVQAGEILTVRFEDYCINGQGDLVTTAYPDAFPGAGHTIVTNTASGFADAAAESPVCLSVSSMYYDDGHPLTLSGDAALGGTLLCDKPVVIPADKTLSLADAFNGFWADLRVEGTLNLNSTGENCTLFNSTVDVIGTVNNNGSLIINGDSDRHISIFGALHNTGRLENYGEMYVEENGTLDLQGSDAAITYDPNAADEWGNQIGWWGAEDHVMFNCGYLQVKANARLTVGGGLENDRDLDVLGTMEIQSPSQDNTPAGILNGSTKNFGRINVIGGTVTVEASGAGNYAGALVNIGEFRLSHDDDADRDSRLNANGLVYNYGNLELNNGTAAVSGMLYNGDENFSDCAWINVNDGSIMVISGYLRNENEVNINGGTLNLYGTMDNSGDVRNCGDFKVYEPTRIYNDGHLFVADSATFGSNAAFNGTYDGFNSITWMGQNDQGEFFEKQDITEAEKRTILSDASVYRVWTVYGPETRQLEENFCAVKGSELYGNIVMYGQDYFGGWVDAGDVNVEIVEVRPDSADENESEVARIHTAGENYGTFRLYFENWGSAQLKLSEESNTLRTYELSVCLNYGGFYYTDDILNEEGRLDYERGKDAAVLGNAFIYNNGEEIWYMRNDSGFSWSEVDCTECFRFEIWPESGNGGEAQIDCDQNNWFHVILNGEEYMSFTPVQRRNTEDSYDLLFRFSDTASEDFEISGQISDTGFYTRCLKPAVYIEDAAVLSGEGQLVTVAVKARNIYNLGGYNLSIGFPKNVSLEAGGVLLDDRFTGTYDVEVKNEGQEEQFSVVHVAAQVNDAALEVNCIEDTAIFTLTFKVNSDLNPQSGEINPDNGRCYADIGLWFWYDDNDATDENMICRNTDHGDVVCARTDSGYIEPFLPGDVLRDGRVNIRDAVRLLRASVDLVDDLSAGEYQAGFIAAPGAGQSVNPTSLSAVGVMNILNCLARGTELCYYAPGAIVSD